MFDNLTTDNCVAHEVKLNCYTDQFISNLTTLLLSDSKNAKSQAVAILHPYYLFAMSQYQEVIYNLFKDVNECITDDNPDNTLKYSNITKVIQSALQLDSTPDYKVDTILNKLLPYNRAEYGHNCSEYRLLFSKICGYIENFNIFDSQQCSHYFNNLTTATIEQQLICVIDSLADRFNNKAELLPQMHMYFATVLNFSLAYYTDITCNYITKFTSLHVNCDKEYYAYKVLYARQHYSYIMQAIQYMFDSCCFNNSDHINLHNVYAYVLYPLYSIDCFDSILT